MITLRSQRTTSRYHFYKSPGHISPSDWRLYDIDSIGAGQEPMSVLNRFLKIFEYSVATGNGEILDAYWRLVAELDNGETLVLTPTPLRQGVDVPNAEEIRLRFILNNGIKLGEPPPEVTIDTTGLPTLDDTPVPTGTVVEVLDEWGLPTGSTEVT